MEEEQCSARLFRRIYTRRIDMKKILTAAAVVLAVFVLASCGISAGGNKNALAGTWEITDGDGGKYGIGIKFDKKGKFYYAAAADAGTQKELQETFEAMSMLYDLTYDIKSDTEMDVTLKLFGGFGGKETVTVQYRLDGDTLFLDGST